MKKLVLFAILFNLTAISFAQNERIIVGAERTKEYFPILKNKRIAVFSNHTGMVGNKHTLDILLE
ncbi:MAG TPA: DUF1343 domain-containing protein, partial [Paludibacteraceae bacterium]|nr:DUF1343 domain-containing protein [Paludibacteraceae bacterium]